jgi:hypothetical protein
LPIQILEIDEEMPLFDLHTVGFWGMKNAGKMADTCNKGRAVTDSAFGL